MSAMTPGEAASFARIVELELDPLPGHFDAAHLRAIHGHIFQDSPEYTPGRYRPENPGGVYIKNRALEAGAARYHVHYRTEGIAAAVDDALARFGGPATLQGLTVEDAAEKLSVLYGDLDYAHPFREGNSRTLRQFTRQLTRAAGYTLDWSPTPADASSRDGLYIARDLAVASRAFPGLNRDRAMETDSRAEYETWVMFVSRYQDRPRLQDLMRSSLSGEGRA